MSEDVQFHSERAMAELDRALQARCAAAARAHLGLSSLHLQRIMTIREGSAEDGDR